MSRPVPHQIAMSVLLSSLLLACGTSPATESLQAASIEAPPYVSNSSAPVRLRVSFIGDSANLPVIGVRNVKLCGQGCLQLGESRGVALPDDGSGHGTLYADVSTGAVTFDRIIVQPDPTVGANANFSVLHLPAPVTLREGRQELFLNVSAVRKGQSTHWAVSYLGTQQVPAQVEDVRVYRPDRALQAELTGTQLKVPAGSLRQPQVFSLEQVNTGEISPTVKAWPPLASAAPVSVEFRPDVQKLPRGLTLDDYVLKAEGVGGAIPRTAGDSSSLRFNVPQLSNLALVPTREVLETDSGDRFALPNTRPLSVQGHLQAQSTQACKDALVANRQSYENLFTAGNVAVKTNVCEGVAPYVHIVLVDRTKKYNVITQPITPSGTQYALKTISQHAAQVSAIAAINGFYWQGDEGTAAGQLGTPSTTLITDGVTRFTYTGAEALLGFERNPLDGTKGTSVEFFSRTAGGTVNFNTHNYNVIASTTSIIKGGVCSRTPDGNSNLWSAVGIGFNRMAMVSSVTGQYSETYELCSVFEGLNYLTGAIRLDGGPSASLYWKGAHLNPLSGLAYLKYGNARYVMHALALK